MNKKGVTLVEVLVASLIIAITITGIMLLFVHQQKTLVINNSFYAANKIITRHLENHSAMITPREDILKNLKVPPIAGNYSIPSSPIIVKEPSNLTNVSEYKISIKCSSVDVPEAKYTNSLGVEVTQTCMQIDVTADWEVLGTKQTLTLSTKVK